MKLTKNDYIKAYNVETGSVEISFVLRYCVEQNKKFKDLNKLVLSNPYNYSRLIDYFNTKFEIIKIYDRGILTKIV